MTLPFKIVLGPELKRIENQMHQLGNAAKMYEFIQSHTNKMSATFKNNNDGSIQIFVDVDGDLDTLSSAKMFMVSNNIIYTGE